jgi:hypothetical protein
MIHDSQFDYYAKKLATCSSDKTIKIFEVVGDKYLLSSTLLGTRGCGDCCCAGLCVVIRICMKRVDDVGLSPSLHIEPLFFYVVHILDNFFEPNVLLAIRFFVSVHLFVLCRS